MVIKRAYEAATPAQRATIKGRAAITSARVARTIHGACTTLDEQVTDKSSLAVADLRRKNEEIRNSSDYSAEEKLRLINQNNVKIKRIDNQLESAGEHADAR